MTAAHTIRNDAHLAVILADGKSVRAQLAGRDTGTDIALLRVDENISVEFAEFGPTKALAVGELVVAIARTRRGNIVASAGILSGLMGEWQAGRTRIDQFIRPDLTLYPGFSGGGLIGGGGKILGMNAGGVLRGKPLTIPGSTLIRVAEELASTGHVARPYVGLVMQPVNIPESLQKQTGVNVSGGLLVMHVEPQGPADTSGVLLGDVLIDLDGHKFDDLEDLHAVLQQRGANQDVKATTIRGGQKVELTIRIGERPIR